MKAAQIKEYGGIENIEVVDIDKPQVGDDQVLVEVYASSLNPIDTAMREGHTRQMADIPLPATLGSDIAGVVVETGKNVTNFKVGDKVYGQALALGGASGALAEYVATPAIYIAMVPSSLSFTEAASFPIAGASAVQALVDHMQLKSGQKLFIHGASGGIGTIAIQIAKSLGAYVAASAKTDRVEFVKSLGADEVIDTDKQDFSTMLKDYDAALVLARGDEWAKLFSILKPDGSLVSLIGPAEGETNNIKFFPQMTQTNTEHLDSLSKFIEKGIVTPQVDQVFSLDQIQAAFAKREGGGNSGKIVIEIKK
jgi:NADPH:quinone reductase-like Zn-dependent oxidoreductase